MRKPQKGIEDNNILTSKQKYFLKEFARSELRDVFRLTGGTALSAFYLGHRLSEDLDFFSSEKIPFHIPEKFLKTLQDVEEMNYTKMFDRNIFSLTFKDGDSLKTEFTYYTLKNLEETVVIDRLRIDSFLDIVVNKLCAIADRFEAKDYIDVYFSLKDGTFALRELICLAEKKCEIKGISYILKSRLLQVPEGIDRLSLLSDVTWQKVESYFRDLIKEMVTKEIADKGDD